MSVRDAFMPFPLFEICWGLFLFTRLFGPKGIAVLGA
jgi:hypothetical protein